MFRRLWGDELGFVVSAELTLVATVLVVGMLVGLVSVRDQMVQELGDLAVALGVVNQSFSFSGVSGHTSGTAGSCFCDLRDFCDAPYGAGGWSGSACINVFGSAATQEGPFTYPQQMHPHQVQPQG
jgi:hypothetical protein